MTDEKKKPDSSISSITDTRSAADDVIEAMDAEFPNATRLRRDDMPYYPLQRKKGVCPKCGKSEYSGTPLNSRTKYECRACGNTWFGPMVPIRRPKVMFLKEAKSERPIQDPPREPQRQWRRTR
jgi:DNA-directed RNA polymerase subunit M/transcription elongation factor TFIIS